MNVVSEAPSGSGLHANKSMAEPAPVGDDPRLVAALREYAASLEAGIPVDRSAFRARYAGCASELNRCLEGLEMLHAVGPRLDIGPSEARGSEMKVLFGNSALLKLGDFEIIREIGRGGMGIVYEAVQLSLGRKVALKVLPFASSLDPRQLLRFKNEAQAAAYLHHTNIVPIFGVGNAQGVHYYAMQFIEGQTLAGLIQEFRRLSRLGQTSSREQMPETVVAPPGPLPGSDDPLAETAATPPVGCTLAETLSSGKGSAAKLMHRSDFHRRVAQLGLQAAEALEHAHQQGVVHRDIKPGNLLVDCRGNLWITDFGLAHMRNNASLTISGDLLGTLRYMSPEQALARRGMLDHRTDIYSLGVTLYEMLTLQPVFGGSDRQELLQQIAFEEPKPPRRINKSVPSELETIVMKAMEKNVGDRYASAHEMAADLRRFLEDQPIHARRPTLLDRVRKWTRRHRNVVFTAVGIGFFSLLAQFYLIGQLLSEKNVAEAAHHSERVQRLTAQSAVASAKEHRTRAESNFNKLRFTVTNLFQRLEDKKWSLVPEIGDIRKAMAEDLQQCFTQLLACDASPDCARRIEVGWAHMLVGNVARVQGESEKALNSFGHAIGLFQELYNSYPEDPVYQQELAFGRHMRGLLLDLLGQKTAAWEDFVAAAEHYACASAKPEKRCVLNNYAWFLATCPQAEFRDASRSIELARRMLAFDDRDGIVWNTLGVAFYRAGEWQEAIRALERSMSLREGGDGFDWLFLAMSHFQLGDQRQARNWYDRAVKNLEKTNIYNEPIAHMRTEAEVLLGVPEGTKKRTPCILSQSLKTAAEAVPLL